LNDLEKSFEEQFWPAYRELVRTPFPQKWGAGAKGKAKKFWLEKLRPNENLQQRIMEAIGAQRIYRQNLYKQCGSAERYLRYTDMHRESIHANRVALTGSLDVAVLVDSLHSFTLCLTTMNHNLSADFFTRRRHNVPLPHARHGQQASPLGGHGNTAYTMPRHR